MRFGGNWRLWVLASVMALLPAVLWAGDRASKRAAMAQAAKAAHAGNTVELFSAMENGQVDVKLVPKDSSECRVLIENKTDKPLTIKLPDSFAGVPVLAQNAGRTGGNSMGGGGSQGMGGGMGGMGGGGMGGGGMGMGMFNVPPEKVGQFKVPTVCLEHGKDEPRPAIAYTIKPLEQFSDKPGVKELCSMLGTGQVDQRAAQVAAWHLNNGMSFEQLAAKQLHYADGTSRPYFSPQEMRAGMMLVNTALATAKQNAEKAEKSGQSQNAPVSQP